MMGGAAIPEEEQVDVLLVEDDQAVAQMYRLKLELDGYTVAVAADGEEALQMAAKAPPDLIFLDIRLPKLDGFAVLEGLRADEKTRYTPVVILSNYGEPELVERGLKLGALEYVIKSQTTPSQLSGNVEGWVATNRPARASR
jgi:CheY-like chemotaxis protein